ncbi:hypothetical protein MRX96_036474 [Rhipicephalus microplus]
MEGGGNKTGARRRNSKNHRKECKEPSAFARIREDDAPRCSRSLDSLTCSGPSAKDRDNCGGNHRTHKNQRHGKHQQRRPSVQSEVAAGERDQDRSNARGSRKGKSPNNKNGGPQGTTPSTFRVLNGSGARQRQKYSSKKPATGAKDEQ